MLLFELDDLAAKNIAYNDTLNPKLFDESGQMRPEVRNALMNIANNFLDDIRVPGLDIDDIMLVGSSANYNYTPYSDADLHLTTNIDLFKDPEMASRYFKATKNVWNNKHDVAIRGVDVEVYVEHSDLTNRSLGRYSVKDDKWITKPTHDDPTYDNEAINRKVRFLEREIDNLVNGELRDEEAYTRLRKKISKMREAGLERGGEYDTENLAYKVLRNMGKLQGLIDAQTDAADREMSLT